MPQMGSIARDSGGSSRSTVSDGRFHFGWASFTLASSFTCDPAGRKLNSVGPFVVTDYNSYRRKGRCCVSGIVDAGTKWVGSIHLDQPNEQSIEKEGQAPHRPLESTSFASLRLGVFALNSYSSVPIFRPHGWVPNLEENRSEEFLTQRRRGARTQRNTTRPWHRLHKHCVSAFWRLCVKKAGEAGQAPHHTPEDFFD